MLVGFVPWCPQQQWLLWPAEVPSMFAAASSLTDDGEASPLALWESRHEPAKAAQLVQDWPALSRWAQNDFARLRQLVGGVQVQVMYSSSSNFYGDIKRHAPVTCSMEEFLDSQHHSSETAHFYLAQAQMTDSTGLVPLLRDVSTPALLDQAPISQVNFWMCIRGSNSSLHYDPYQNLLCCVAGRKLVRLLPPSATPCLYPMHVASDSANHSQVDFAAPDLQRHPHYRHVQDKYVTIELEAGDAVFIPEGWWHQVDSHGTTIAVNFWWPSAAARLLQGAGTAMAPYYLRQLLASCVADTVQQLLDGIRPVPGLRAAPEGHSGGAHECAAAAAAALAEALQEELKQGGAAEAAPSAPSSTASPAVSLLGSRWSALGFERSSTRLLASLPPLEMMEALFLLAQKAPTLVSWFLLCGLSPAATQVLTTKLELADGDPPKAPDNPPKGPRSPPKAPKLELTDGEPPKSPHSPPKAPSLELADGQRSRVGEQEEQSRVLEREPRQAPTQAASSSGAGPGARNQSPGACVFPSVESFYSTLYGTLDGAGQVDQVLANLTAGRQAVGDAVLHALAGASLSVPVAQPVAPQTASDADQLLHADKHKLQAAAGSKQI